MLWFLKLLHGKSLKVKIADLNHVTCAKPNHLKGKLVKDLKKDDVCGGEGRPYVDAKHKTCEQMWFMWSLLFQCYLARV
jgi:hypothetical protein